ncbi:phloem protein 2-A13 [Perilla frutescens var. hirtella]|uniref:Phloem protein 2-A13 n=1 Tax=Perilla frutescens var. hirtella TaxID=608512 RepID=A0AAD4ILE8_PERFH|nr:phloem protein 2-A13 [Perilla frutescens var. hirtella]
MGSFVSLLASRGWSQAAAPPPEPGLGDLPESCLAAVLARLEPPQICRLATLNSAFRGASSADFVWESKLPANYQNVIARVFEEYDDFRKDLCKKDIYARLSSPIFFDGGTKEVWLDKMSGKTCMSMSWNGLAITGIDDRRYWTRVLTEESRFGSVAYLQQIWWFEVDGEIDFPFPAGSYSLFFRLQLGRAQKKFGRRLCNSEHVHGWDKKPAKFQISTSDGQKTTKHYHLKEPGKWIYYHVGDFVAADSCKSMKLKFSITQIDCTHTKGGLCVDGVAIYPLGRGGDYSVFNCEQPLRK